VIVDNYLYIRVDNVTYGWSEGVKALYNLMYNFYFEI